MDPRTWPLSVAATQRLLDLRADRRSVSSEAALLTLAAKELVLRGAIHTDEVIKKRRDSKLMVSTQAATSAMPAAPALLLSRLERAHRMDLTRLVRNAVRKHPRLRAEVAAAARGELEARGLIARGERRVLGVFPQRYDVLTPAGESWQRAAQQIIDRGDQLAIRSGEAPPTPTEVDALGPLLLLVGGGLAMGARTSARRRVATAGTMAATGVPGYAPGNAFGDDLAPLDGYDGGTDPFSVLDGLGDAFSGVLDDALSALDSGVDSAFDSLDSAFEAVDSAIGSIDSAMDSSFSDGGGFGGDGGGGDGGGGGD